MLVSCVSHSSESFAVVTFYSPLLINMPITKVDKSLQNGGCINQSTTLQHLPKKLKQN